MNFDITHENRTTLSVDYGRAVELGYPVEAIGKAVKACAVREVEAFANTLRARVASTAAGKLIEYRFKEEIARDESSSDPAELAQIDREASARGMDRASLLGLISAEAKKHRQAALLVGSLEAEMKAAVSVPPDDTADIETQIQALLAAAKAAADAELTAVLAQNNAAS